MGDKPRVLVFIDWYYPGYKAGGPIQSCRNLVARLKDDFEFYIFTSDRDLKEDRSFSGIEVNTWNQGPSGEHIYYAERKRVTSQSIIKILDAVKPSVIYLNSMFSYEFTIIPLLALKKIDYEKKIILAPRGMLQKGALSFKPLKKRIFLTIMKLFAIHKKIVFHATDTQELQDIKVIFPHNQVLLALNIPRMDIPFKESFMKDIGRLRLIFFSRIHEKKNLVYALEVLASQAFKGTITFDVYGEFESDNYLNKCREIVLRLPGNVKVNFLGGVSNTEGLNKLAQNHVFILPTLGENFGHVIYESLMSGTPVIVSDKTPWRNLESDRAGWDLPLNNIKGFAETISNLLDMDQQTHSVWRKGARRRAESYLQNADFKSQYRAIFL